MGFVGDRINLGRFAMSSETAGIKSISFRVKKETASGGVSSSHDLPCEFKSVVVGRMTA